MARPITTLAIFFLGLSLFSQMLISTGVAGVIGINANVGQDKAVNEVTQETEGETDTGSPGGETLFGLYNVLAGTLSTIVGIINPGIRMLENVGLPDHIATFMYTLASLIKTIGIISFLRGWDL